VPDFASNYLVYCKMHRNANKTGGLPGREAAGSYILDRMVQRGLEVSLVEGNSGLPFGNGFVADRELGGQLALGEAFGLAGRGDELADPDLIHGGHLLSGMSVPQAGREVHTRGGESGMRSVERGEIGRAHV